MDIGLISWHGRLSGSLSLTDLGRVPPPAVVWHHRRDCRSTTGRASQRCCRAIRRLWLGPGGKRLLPDCLAWRSSLTDIPIGLAPIRELQKSEDRQHRKPRRKARAVHSTGLTFVPSGAILAN